MCMDEKGKEDIYTIGGRGRGNEHEEKGANIGRTERNEGREDAERESSGWPSG